MKRAELMTIKDASQYLGIKPPTLYKYVKAKVIPAFKIGNMWRIKRSVLEDWLERKARQSVTEALERETGQGYLFK